MRLGDKGPQMTRQLELPLGNRGETPTGKRSEGSADGGTRRASLVWTTMKDSATVAGITTSTSCWSASRSSSPSGPGLLPPRPEKPPRGQRSGVELVRSPTRPERHFEDSFITVRQAFARALATWPRTLPAMPSSATNAFA
jgi:hypothetical protein